MLDPEAKAAGLAIGTSVCVQWHHSWERGIVAELVTQLDRAGRPRIFHRIKYDDGDVVDEDLLSQAVAVLGEEYMDVDESCYIPPWQQLELSCCLTLKRLVDPALCISCTHLPCTNFDDLLQHVQATRACPVHGCSTMVRSRDPSQDVIRADELRPQLDTVPGWQQVVWLRGNKLSLINPNHCGITPTKREADIGAESPSAAATSRGERLRPQPLDVEVDGDDVEVSCPKRFCHHKAPGTALRGASSSGPPAKNKSRSTVDEGDAASPLCSLNGAQLVGAKRRRAVIEGSTATPSPKRSAAHARRGLTPTSRVPVIVGAFATRDGNVKLWARARPYRFQGELCRHCGTPVRGNSSGCRHCGRMNNETSFDRPQAEPLRCAIMAEAFADANGCVRLLLKARPGSWARALCHGCSAPLHCSSRIKACSACKLPVPWSSETQAMASSMERMMERQPVSMALAVSAAGHISCELNASASTSYQLRPHARKRSFDYIAGDGGATKCRRQFLLAEADKLRAESSGNLNGRQAPTASDGAPGADGQPDDIKP